MYTVATFYHFFDFSDYAEKREPLLALLTKHDIKGSILIAAEGFNGTISGTRENIDAVLAHLKTLGGEFEHKESMNDKPPFKRAKVRLKKELISLIPRLERGSDKTCGTRPPLKAGDTGIYVEAKDWNALISSPDTIVLDARNWYETHMGGFENAIDPDTQNFRELPNFIRKNLKDAKLQKIATYCTGGIRCEKLTAWMKQEGFEHVYHLKGGILKYLEEIPEDKSKWNGECYVFDERIAVGHGLAPSTTASICPACGNSLKEEDKKHPLYIEGTRCGFCEG